jgi:hypothetical protein
VTVGITIFEVGSGVLVAVAEGEISVLVAGNFATLVWVILSGESVCRVIGVVMAWLVSVSGALEAGN